VKKDRIAGGLRLSKNYVVVILNEVKDLFVLLDGDFPCEGDGVSSPDEGSFLQRQKGTEKGAYGGAS